MFVSTYPHLNLKHTEITWHVVCSAAIELMKYTEVTKPESNEYSSAPARSALTVSRQDFCVSVWRVQNMEILKSETFFVLYSLCFPLWLWKVVSCSDTVSCRQGIVRVHHWVFLVLECILQKWNSAVQLESHVLTALRGWYFGRKPVLLRSYQIADGIHLNHPVSSSVEKGELGDRRIKDNRGTPKDRRC